MWAVFAMALVFAGCAEPPAQNVAKGGAPDLYCGEDQEFPGIGLVDETSRIELFFQEKQLPRVCKRQSAAEVREVLPLVLGIDLNTYEEEEFRRFLHVFANYHPTGFGSVRAPWTHWLGGTGISLEEARRSLYAEVIRHWTTGAVWEYLESGLRAFKEKRVSREHHRTVQALLPYLTAFASALKDHGAKSINVPDTLYHGSPDWDSGVAVEARPLRCADFEANASWTNATFLGTSPDLTVSTRFWGETLLVIEGATGVPSIRELSNAPGEDEYTFSPGFEFTVASVSSFEIPGNEADWNAMRGGIPSMENVSLSLLTQRVLSTFQREVCVVVLQQKLSPW